MAKQKTTKDRIDLTVVVDRSGSMQAMQQEAESGLNHFFTEQAKAAPNTHVTLVQFDTEYEFVHKDEPIKGLKPYTLVPRGCTALLDAAGKAAAEAVERFNRKGKEIAKKIFVVLTDGQENSSREWTKGKVKDAIERLKDAGCEIVFLGANIDSFAEGASLGVPVGTTANYAGTPQGVAQAFAATTDNALSYSTGGAQGMAYSEKQRRSMTGDQVSDQDPLITPRSIDNYRKARGMSWASLERAAGLGNTTLKRYAKGDTKKLNQTTQERLRASFPDLDS